MKRVNNYFSMDGANTKGNQSKVWGIDNLVNVRAWFEYKVSYNFSFVLCSEQLGEELVFECFDASLVEVDAWSGGFCIGIPLLNIRVFGEIESEHFCCGHGGH